MSEKLSKFVVGDQVRIKSGGPSMTVNKVNNVLRHYECKWFDAVKKNFKKLDLSEEVLEKYDPESDNKN